MILQKQLGWLQRYLYTITGGPLPFPQPVVELANEPFEWTPFRVVYNVPVGAGTFTPIFVPADTTKRRLIVYVSVSSPTVIATSDNFGVTLAHDGRAYPLVASRSGNGGGNLLMLVGGSLYMGEFDRWVNTGRPIMVGPGDTLQVDHVSLVGIGDDVTIRALGIELDRSAPFPSSGFGY